MSNINISTDPAPNAHLFCPYCNHPLHQWYFNSSSKHPPGQGIQGFKCTNCPIVTAFDIDIYVYLDKQIGIIIATRFFLDDESPVRCIDLNNKNNSMQLTQEDSGPNNDHHVVLEINYIPDNLSPSNAEEFWHRLMNIKAFS